MSGPGPSAGPQPQAKRLAGVKSVVAVASGKGGVGKSTVACNLALALSRLGKKVGLLDADIYGPSQHIMLGVRDHTPESNAERKVIPIDKFGIRLMTFGFFLKPEEAVVWRGPMVGRMNTQFIDDVLLNELDVLIVDLPPGTGDVQLTLTQILPLTGVVIVSTPQDVALADAIKGINMFQKVNVPVLGLIENMSFFACPSCGHHTNIFSHGGTRHKAEEMGVQFLGELPLEENTRACADQGKPIVVKEPDSEQSKRFATIAEKVWGAVEEKLKDVAPVFNVNLGGQVPAGKFEV
jgi:ATP-binding protein involved in chromosome partitioning